MPFLRFSVLHQSHHPRFILPHPITSLAFSLLAAIFVVCSCGRARHDVTNASSAASVTSSPRPRGGRHGPRNAEGAEEVGGVCELEISCRGDDVTPLLPIRLPIRGPRGPGGKDGEKGERGEDGVPGVPGLPGLAAPTPTKAAFFVGLQDNIGPVKEQTDVIFDRVITNVGGAYGAESGRFTAPISAVYQFHVTVSAQGRQRAAVMLVKNGEMVVTVWAESIPYWASASNQVTLELDRADQVWLVLISRASHLHGYMYSTFSGALLFER